MIGTVEGPYEDEALMGVVARTFDCQRGIGRKRVGLHLAGTYGATIHVELPTNLGTFTEALGRRLGLGVDELIARTTALPLYAPFLTTARFHAVRDAMVGKGVCVSSILGLHADRTTAQQWLLFCPACREEDQREHGFSWWRRTPQARGVEICDRHGISLAESQFSRGGSWALDYPLVDDATVVSSSGMRSDFSRAIATNTRWLLNENHAPIGPERLRAAYFAAAEENGFVRNDRLLRSDLLHAIAERFDPKHLLRLGLGFDPDSPYSWPAKLIVGAGECHPPLRHLALIFFLRLNAKRFMELSVTAAPRPKNTRGGGESEKATLRILWNDPNISLNEIVRRMGINYATVRTWASTMGLPFPRIATAKQRAAFVTKRSKTRKNFLAVKGRRSKIRVRLLKWLSRNDRAWLASKTCARSTRQKGRVDWKERDRRLARAVPSAARRLRACRPFRKVTITGLTTELRCSGPWQRAFGRLPLFRAVACRTIESNRAFVLRRIRVLRHERPGLPRWQLREL